MKKPIEEIICEVLMDYEFDDDYIKYGSYKYKLFCDCLHYANNYKAIGDDMNICFNGKEKEALFKILGKSGCSINQSNNYYFTKRK